MGRGAFPDDICCIPVCMGRGVTLDGMALHLCSAMGRYFPDGMALHSCLYGSGRCFPTWRCIPACMGRGVFPDEWRCIPVCMGRGALSPLMAWRCIRLWLVVGRYFLMHGALHPVCMGRGVIP
ncbi:hypothetical protein AVEN_48660-1 [Araneus ventricosus]|uniref:Uncharacterized protein n=1 Tax=Araneus ventricosus TaxID=182803 RepID=A0A4Y2W7B2_ARAVE|nr:hypothetical protein AVEN_48660-1 [Araneus ventricosus]